MSRQRRPDLLVEPSAHGGIGSHKLLGFEPRFGDYGHMPMEGMAPKVLRKRARSRGERPGGPGTAPAVPRSR